MPKNTNEKNNKGKKTTAKTTQKKVQPKKEAVKKQAPKKVETKKQEPKTQVIKEVKPKKEVVKKVEKERKIKVLLDELLKNTPFLIAACIIIVLLAILIFVGCYKRIPKTSDSKQIIATLKGKKITADELYEELKENNGTDALINIIDTYIANKEVKITDEDKDYVDQVVNYYKDYAEYYGVDLATFLANYVGLSGITTEKEFKNYVLKDYKKTLAVTKFIGDNADEKDLKEYYKENYTDKLNVKHILVEVDSEAEDTEAADQAALNKAKDLINQLNDTASDNLDTKFNELAENNSDDTATYSNGGLIENITKKDVEEALEGTLKDNASLVLKEGEAALGDVVVMDFVGRINGEAFDGGSAQNHELELGSHQFIPGFEEQLVGHKAGEKVDVNVTFPENYTEALKGKPAVFECTIHEVKEKKLPELNDEFVKELKVEGIETVEAFRNRKEEDLKRQKEQEARREYMSKLIAEIVKNSQIDLADEIVENQTESRKEDMIKRIEQSGLQLEQYLQILGQTEEQFVAQLREQALKETQEYIVLEEIGKAENIEIDDAQLEFEYAKIADQYNMKIEDVKKALENNLDEFRHNLKMQRIDDLLYNENK